MERPYKICFLGYRKLGEIAREVIAKLDYDDTQIIEKDCNISDLPETVNEALAEGCEVFIAGSANAAEFRNRSYRHLVEVKVDIRDYLLSIRKAVAMGGEHVGIAVYRYSNTLNEQLLRKLIDVPIEVITYEDSAELYALVRNSSCDVLVGASFAEEVAENLGRKSVLIYESEYTVRASIERARRRAAELGSVAREREVTAAILRNCPAGLIVTDEQGRITVFNAAARRLTAAQEDRVRGRLLSEVLPGLSYEAFCKGGQEPTDRRHIINGAMLRCAQTPIRDGKDSIGMLTTLLPDNSRRKRTETAENHGLSAPGKWEQMIAESPAMKELLGEARMVAAQEHPVMIMGEPGTGKRFLAQCIHNGSSRARAPYLVLNAATLAEQDAARVLFGSEEAGGIRTGLLELAAGGTVVLQNLAQASAAFTACILQALTERSFFRVGGVTDVPFRARLVTLAGETDREKTPEDLWQRLSVFSLTLPPLRQRKEDILPLFQYYLTHEEGHSSTRSQRDLAETLEFYSWPGNLAALAGVSKRYALYLRQAVNPSPSARQLLLIRAIGDEELLRDIYRRCPALLDAANSPAEQVLEGVSLMKHYLRYNNSIIADKLGLGRTTLWRMQKSLEDTDEK